MPALSFPGWVGSIPTPMNDRTSARIDRVSSLGQPLVKALIQQPVKEAVRESLDEEQFREHAHAEGSSRPEAEELIDEPSSEGTDGRSFPVKSVLAVVALAGGILLVRRLRGGDSGPDTSERTAGKHEEAVDGERTSRVSGERFSSTTGPTAAGPRGEE